MNCGKLWRNKHEIQRERKNSEKDTGEIEIFSYYNFDNAQLTVWTHEALL